jgi:uncharacterized protein (TIGR03435 family)
MTPRACFITCAVLAAFSFPGIAQTPARAEFEVATIKLNSKCETGRGAFNAGAGGLSPGRLGGQCMSLRTLIQIAYQPGARRLQALGGPAWLDSDLYDLDAKAGGNAPIMQMVHEMLQMLLEARCKLSVQKETRELPVYALTIAKGGARLQTSKEGSCTPYDIKYTRLPGEPKPNFCGSSFAPSGLNMVFDGTRQTMADFAGRLSSIDIGRPVIDKTDLTGSFDIRLEYAPAPSADSTGPSIFTAVEEQLGLKLASDKGPVEVLVIDHVERPSEN